MTAKSVTVRLTALNNIISADCPCCGDTFGDGNIGKLQREMTNHIREDHGIVSIKWRGDAG